MDIKFSNGVYVIDNKSTLIPSTFRVFKYTNKLVVKTLNGVNSFEITEDDTLDGASVSLDDFFNFFITNG